MMGSFLADQRQGGSLADQMIETVIVRVHGNGGVTQHGLGAGGGYDEIARPVGQGIPDVMQVAGLVLVFDLVVGQGGMTTVAPVDDVVALVDQPFLEKFDKDLAHGLGALLVKGEALTGPVHGCADAADLAQDMVALLLFPLPDALDELVAAQIVAGQPLFLELALHHVLGGDARMVGAGHPQHVFALLAIEAAQNVLKRQVQGMAHMQDTGDIGRRDDDGIGLARTVGVRGESLVRFPMGFPFFFHIPRFVGFG